MKTKITKSGSMRPSVKKRWLTALRSGKYRHGRGVLRQDDIDEETGKTVHIYCAQGVLCDLYLKTQHRGKWIAHEQIVPFVTPSSDSRFCMPAEVARWAGIGDYTRDLIAGINDRANDFSKVITFITRKL